MADVRKEGQYYVTLRRIYTEFQEGRKGRSLIHPVGRRLKKAEVERLGLSVEDAEEKPAPKPRAKKK